MIFKSWFILKQNFLKVSVAMLCLLLLSCSPASDDGSSSSSFTSLAQCEYLYEPVFIATYYDVITTSPRTCTLCHSSPGVSHEIAIPDSAIAFDNFLLISGQLDGFGKAEDARQLLKSTIIDDTHQSSGSSTYTALVDSYESQWLAVQSSYDACVNSF